MLKSDLLSIIVLTKNEEQNIENCLKTLLWCDEIIIIDDFSSDLTLERIRAVNSPKIKVFRHKSDGDFSSQRNYALTKAKKEWVLFVDADERVPEPLRNEIVSVVGDSKGVFGYSLKRIDNIWGKELKHGETESVGFVRLARKDSGKWVGAVHEEWQIKGRIGKLNNSLYHYPHQTIASFLEEINFYTSIRADELYKEGKKANLLSILLYTKGKFIMNFLIKRGFLDGIPGLISALLMSFHSFLVRGKLWMLSKENE